MPQAATGPVHGGDQARRVRRRLSHPCQGLTRFRTDQLHRDGVAAPNAGDSAHHECLHPFPQGHLAREQVVQGEVGGALHPLEGGAHLPRGHDLDVGRLLEVDPKRLSDRDGEGRVSVGGAEVGDEQPVSWGDHARGDQGRLIVPSRRSTDSNARGGQQQQDTGRGDPVPAAGPDRLREGGRGWGRIIGGRRSHRGHRRTGRAQLGGKCGGVGRR